MLTSLHRLLSRKAPLALLAAALLWLTPAIERAGAQDLPYSQGLLWQVQREGGGPVSYVLGTIHSTDARLRKLPPQIDQAFSQSRVAVFELIDSQQGNDRMARAMRLPPDRRLEDILGPELFRRTAEAVAPLGITPDVLQILKPWALGPFLSYPPLERVRLAQGEPAFDNWLQAEARRRGKMIEALESWDEQIQIFDGMSEAEQVAMVTDLLADHENIEAIFNRIFRAYLKGDLSVAMAEANDVSGVSDVEAAERFKARLIDERNRIMAARIAPLLRDGGAFVAIGAAHLPGEDGVLARLAARGYSVTRAY
ncbi:MAG: TraB/GumN family protein [Kiloniellaceae bacterium]